MAEMTETEKLRANVTGTELVWEGKRTQVERVPLPFQVIETINQSRATREQAPLLAGLPAPPLFESVTSNKDVWRNKLIWGDNKYILASLLEEGFAGKLNLIYIDPPFATGADFSINMKVGDVQWTKEASIIEEKAYRDTWGKGLDSYIEMLYERLVLMKDLLADTGSIYVHLDWHVGHYVKLLMDDIFGRDNFRNEIHCKRVRKNVQEYEATKRLNVALDGVLFYAKSESHRITQPRSEVVLGERWHAFDAPDLRTGMDYELFGMKPPPGRHWMWEKEKAEEAVRQGLLRRNPRTGRPEYKVISENPIISTLWDDTPAYSFQHGFDTEKSEKLLSRILETSTKRGDLVADFFCGSGTTLAVAEKLGRRWLGCDLGRFGIHTTRKRLLDIPDCKPFEILNLGKYERKYWQMNGISGRQKDGQKAIFEYLAFIIKLYHAEPVIGFSHLHGRKAGRMVHVGATDAPVTLSEITEALEECSANKLTALDVLGWEWEMGLHDVVGNEAKRRGIDLRLFNIPREVMDKRAVEAGDVHFYELAYVETEVRQQGTAVQIALRDFIIPSLELVPLEVRDKVKKWSDYVDYWAVDWDFKEDTFHNQWQSYRTRKHSTLAAESDWHNYPSPATYKLLVKIVDIFGNDTTKLLEVKV